MTFWSVKGGGIEPSRKYAFNVKILSIDNEKKNEFSFLAKSANKPTVETDVNEYKLINQINKFPTIPKWNDITIRYVDDGAISKKMLEFMFGKGQSSPTSNNWKANAISKYKSEGGVVNNFKLVIEQLNSLGKPRSTWEFENPFIRSINNGDLDYSDDGFVEVEVVIAYDFAYLT